MKGIIEWINGNNGFIIAILTLVYVIATILICIFNYKSAIATKKQTEESRRQYMDSNRPNIIPCFTMVEGQLFCLTFRNIGNECAKRLRIKINEEWLQCFDKALEQKKLPGDMRRSLKNEFFIVPNDEIKFVLMIPGDGTTMHKELGKEKIKINLKYSRNDLTEEFNEDFELDLVAMSGIIIDQSDYIRKMEKQEKALKGISKNIEHLTEVIRNDNYNG